MKTFCQEIRENWENLGIATRLSSTIGGNKEMDNYTRRHKCKILQIKLNFLTLVDMFSKIE